MTAIGAPLKIPVNRWVRASRAPVLQQDARDRYEDLRRVARRLWADRDDARVLSELIVVLREMNAMEQQFSSLRLRGFGSHREAGAPVRRFV
jgi:hypothetical protein